jgi:hypothetical protein
MKMRTRKTWREKMERIQEPKVVPIPPRMQKRWGTGTILIPAPRDVDAAIRLAGKGQLITQTQIRTWLAGRCGADMACPVTTGIFVRIAAEAAAEAEREGGRQITPWWRVIRDDGTLLEKLPGGPAGLSARLASEGHHVESGKKPRVAGFAGSLIEVPCR